jgi:hypothetical protein
MNYINYVLYQYVIQFFQLLSGIGTSVAEAKVSSVFFEYLKIRHQKGQELRS